MSKPDLEIKRFRAGERKRFPDPLGRIQFSETGWYLIDTRKGAVLYLGKERPESTKNPGDDT